MFDSFEQLLDEFGMTDEEVEEFDRINGPWRCECGCRNEGFTKWCRSCGEENPALRDDE